MTKIYEALVNASEQVQAVRPAGSALQMKAFMDNSDNPTLVTDAEMVTLSHAIESALPGKEKKLIQFMGSRPSEGTSTLSRGFATFSSMNMNKRVLLIDADRKSPTQNQFYGIRSTIGWQEAVCNHMNLEDVLFQVGTASLFLWPSSNSSRITAGIFNPQAISSLLESLRAQFDLVVIDSPPLSQSPDALAMAPYVDGVILVVEAEATRWRVVENTKDRLNGCGARILGVVFNKRRLHIPSFIYNRLK
jgi:capsular exopolysaccharide synthesis family protein